MHSISMKLAAGAALAAFCALCAAQPAGKGWTDPDCRKVSGAPSITFTRNEGAKLAKTSGDMAPFSYTLGLVALEQPDTLLAAVGSSLLRSQDAGCTWQPLADLSGQTGGALLILEAAGGSRAYGWAVNGNALVKVDGDSATVAEVPGTGMTGFHAAHGHAQKLRFGDASGSLWSSLDGGQSWVSRKGVGDWVYRTAFAPRNPDHVLVGTMSRGVFVSFDGGTRWQRSAGLAAGNTSVNVFNVVVSPVDENLVWAMAIDTSEIDVAPAFGRHLYRSEDGGLHFERVVDQDERVTLINGPLLVPHPEDPAVLYFVFGTSFMGYGTDLYRYDHRTGQVTLTHNSYPEIGAIEFHPRKPKLMWLGLVND